MEKKPTVGIVLAAGVSSRFGQPKQLTKLNGKYLLEWVFEACLESKLEDLILVLGHEQQKIQRSLDHKIRQSGIRIAINREYQEGLSQSLRAGLSEVGQKYASAMFLLGDQPMVNSEIINHLLTQFRQSKKGICVPIYRGTRGNPVIFSGSFFDRIRKLKGDVGARNIIQSHPRQVLRVEINDPLCFFDIDTQKDLEILQTALS